MTEQARKPIYSPLQVGAATLLAGPMGGTHLLWANFNSLGKLHEAKITVAVGVSITALLLIFSFASASKANFGMPIAVALVLGARYIAENHQLKKEAITDSVEYAVRSNWNVFWISVAWLAVILVIVILISSVSTLLGFNATS